MSNGNGNHSIEEILAAAKRAQERGVPYNTINRNIRRLTDGKHAGMGALEAAVFRTTTEGQAEEALARTSEHGHLADFLRMAAHGATFGMSDELVALGAKGLLNVAAAGPTGAPAAAAAAADPAAVERLEATRQRISDLREVDPGASLMAEAAGGMIVPLTGAKIARTLGGGVLGYAAGGAAAGGAGGAAYGFGESEGSPQERIPGAIMGGAVGLGVGTLLGAAGKAAAPLLGRAARKIPGMDRILPDPQAPKVTAMRELLPTEQGQARGVRVAENLERLADVDPSVRAVRVATEEGKLAVQRQFYAPLEARFSAEAGGVADEGVMAALRDPDIMTQARLVSREIVGETVRPPTFTELQGVRQRLSDKLSAARNRGASDQVRRYSEALTRMEFAIEEAIPEFKQAQRAWFEVMAVDRAFDQGRAMYSNAAKNSAEEVAMAIEALPTEEAREAFRKGLLNRFVNRLRMRTGVSPAEAMKLVDAGPEMQGKIRGLFPSEANYNEFLTIMQTEHNAIHRATLVRKLVPWTVVMAGVGGGGYAATRGILSAME